MNTEAFQVETGSFKSAKEERQAVDVVRKGRMKIGRRQIPPGIFQQYTAESQIMGLIPGGGGLQGARKGQPCEHRKKDPGQQSRLSIRTHDSLILGPGRAPSVDPG